MNGIHMKFNSSSKWVNDYNIVMSIIGAICLLGLLSSIFPLVEQIASIIFGLVISTGLFLLIHSIVRNNQLDNEAMYGPLDPDKVHHRD